MVLKYKTGKNRGYKISSGINKRSSKGYAFYDNEEIIHRMCVHPEY